MNVRTVALPASPSTGGPTTLALRDEGRGPAVLVLHGGWGADYYPFDAGVRALADAGRRVLLPTRSGYGASTDVPDVPVDFHRCAAGEMRLLLDALRVEETALWGQSDGAVIALHMALAEPARHPALVLESTHLLRRKPRSRAFFRTMAEEPEAFGARVTDALAREHGARWRAVLQRNGRAWLALADEARADGHDLYDGRLASLAPPALVVHGARDPRTEPAELDRLLHEIPRATPLLVDAGHSPHSERATRDGVAAAVVAFLRGRAAVR